MAQCGTITNKGLPCKLTCKHGLSSCHLHVKTECHICMYDIYLRKSVKLSCGHSMCAGCNNRWKNMGKDTCPFCREYIHIDSIEECINIGFGLDGVFFKSLV